MYSEAGIAVVQLVIGSDSAAYVTPLLINGGFSLNMDSKTLQYHSQTKPSSVNKYTLHQLEYPVYKFLSTSPNMTVSKDAMGVLNPVLLEKIDKLRDWNIGHHVPLPQVK